MKRALRIAISKWEKKAKMADEDDQTTQNVEAIVDIDTVRYLNQFGTPDHPLTEVACTPERFGIVKDLFKSNGIELWPDNINPLMAPDMPTTDESK